MAELAVEVLKRHGEVVSVYLQQVLKRHGDAPAKVMEAIEYSVMAGGKRVRPALVLESFEACGGDAARRSSALAAAGAVELIHTFSLVHDDLPAMDDDDLRRGRPTNHKVFGEAMAILAGDAMTSMAYELIARDATPLLVPPLVKELASASGPEGMIGGQVLDMEGEGKQLKLEELKALHRKKTGALLRAACRMGAIAAGAGDEGMAAVTEFAEHLGLAFQIVDDVLDVTATPEQLGKKTNKDQSKGKNTYPVLLGLAESKRAAEEQLAMGLGAIERLGARAAGLAALGRFVVDRKS